MEGTTEYDALIKYFSHIRMTEGHWQRPIYKGSGLQFVGIPPPAGFKPITAKVKCFH